MQAQKDETDLNYDAFMDMLPEILDQNRGSYALMYKKKIVQYFLTSVQATTFGAQRYGMGAFSVQEVTDQPEHLGFYSYVGSAREY